MVTSDNRQNFKRTNPKSDRFDVSSFHHVEFYCGDATSAYKRFMLGLGLELVSKSDQSTGNTRQASYVLQSGMFEMFVSVEKLSSFARIIIFHVKVIFAWFSQLHIAMEIPQS